MRLSWHLPFLEQPTGQAEVERSRVAIAAVVREILPRLDVHEQLLTFVPLGDGRTQVNVHGFGPFGMLEQ